MKKCPQKRFFSNVRRMRLNCSQLSRAYTGRSPLATKPPARLQCLWASDRRPLTPFVGERDTIPTLPQGGKKSKPGPGFPVDPGHRGPIRSRGKTRPLTIIANAFRINLFVSRAGRFSFNGQSLCRGESCITRSGLPIKKAQIQRNSQRLE